MDPLSTLRLIAYMGGFMLLYGAVRRAWGGQ